MTCFIYRFILILNLVASLLQCMENTTKLTDDARPYLSLKKYTHQVGWEKALYAYETVRDNAHSLNQYRSALEEFLFYKTEPKRRAVFATHNAQTQKAIINLSAILMNITGSHWPYTRALGAFLSQDLLIRIGAEICSGGATYDEQWEVEGPLEYMGTGNRWKFKSKEMIRPCLSISGPPKGIIKYDSMRPNMDYTKRYVCVGDDLFYNADTQEPRADCLNMILHNHRTISVRSDIHKMLSFSVLSAQSMETIGPYNDITAVAKVGPNRIVYCKKEIIPIPYFFSGSCQFYGYATYILDLDLKPVETKLCTTTECTSIQSLPYEHFAVGIPNYNGYTFRAYNKYGIAIQNIDRGVRDAIGINCTTAEHCWTIQDHIYKEYKRQQKSEGRPVPHAERCTVSVRPVTYAYDKDKKPDNMEPFDFLLRESIKLGTTALCGNFYALLTTEEKLSTCSVS